jgi:CAAX prenyl protease-like protein
MAPRVLPFSAYLAFLALSEGLAWLVNAVPALASYEKLLALWLYPLKTLTVLGLLVYFWPRYEELREGPIRSGREAFLAIVTGTVVYLAWVRMDWSWAIQGTLSGYNPFLTDSPSGMILAGMRLFGAAVVVPIMEELFWRSFLIRYLISPKFESIRLGTFTPVSFTVTLLLFGLEHQLWLAGMVAGAAYTLLLYRTGRLWPCILAHGITNLLLGIHVLTTQQWQWW